MFGSASRGTDFDSTGSNVDLLVSFGAPRPRFEEYLNSQEQFADRLGHPVDLVTDSAIEDLFLRAGIERPRRAVYRA